jgi:predicted NUDIX family NTP pyrophosphohydrolase
VAKTSAGLLMYRGRGDALEVLLVHPGGPYWAKRDVGAWFVPKGEVLPGEDELSAARREFAEETGFASDGPFTPLGRLPVRSGKVVVAWAFEGDADPATLTSNAFSMEWPPRSGRQQSFPEIDRGGFFTTAAAMDMMHPAEREFLTRLRAAVDGR